MTVDFSALKSMEGAAKELHILDLFAEDKNRADGFSAQSDGLLFDYSKTNIDTTTRDALFGLLDAAGLAEKRRAMFEGDKINDTEGRAVLHTALRNLDGGPVMVDGLDVILGVRHTLARMGDFSDRVRRGEIASTSGVPFEDVVNIGIGGSDLGPAMAVKALAPYHDGPRCHFVSNVDPADVAEVLRVCDPETTLVIVASKPFIEIGILVLFLSLWMTLFTFALDWFVTNFRPFEVKKDFHSIKDFVALLIFMLTLR